MMPLILSLITATLFLTLAGATYGAEALLATAWVPMVALGLLGSGITVYILSEQAKQ
ncbi:hypothetical protein [Thiocapsa roseopersicina]|uniref:Uncharacterized protein n=1 Tax=Thiocapsa roseopersicina TaxID=1058 RepID=A0A1H2VIN1_THIRO|nr:hypothetical protein [Thiocapsa roseopersicina]SDW68182.1 hypothetical protein SAMN05421783_10737 [Thiocapsa roseopersicina]